jgi:hypothetical protein
MQIIDVEGAFKGELVLNPKEMFLECGEGLDQKGALPLLDTRRGPFNGVTAHALIAMGKRTFAPSTVCPVTTITWIEK